jgi:hypothetical protein
MPNSCAQGVMVSGANLFAELKRRNVLRAAAFYAAAAWLLVQVATQVFPFFHIPEWIVRWIVIAAVIGFPFALAVSWFYEWTPSGFMRESDVVATSSAPARSRKVLDRWIVAILVVAIVLLLSDKFVARRDANSPSIVSKSVAVLPMVVDLRRNLSRYLHRILRHGKPYGEWATPSLFGSIFDANFFLDWLKLT